MSSPIQRRLPTQPSRRAVARPLVGRVAAVAAAALVAACGGGGGGDAGSGTGVVSQVGPSLTTSNYVPAAREGISAGDSLIRTSYAAVFGADVLDPSTAMAVVRAQVLDAGRWSARAPQAVVGATGNGSDTTSCPGGGRVDFSVTIARTDGTLSPGDVVQTTSVGCVRGGVTINGQMTVTIVSSTGTVVPATGSFSLNANVDLTGFVVSSSTGSVQLDGTMAFAQTQTSAGSYDIEVATTKLRSQVNYPGISTTRIYEMFRSTDSVRVLTSGGISETVNHLGTIYSSVLGDQPIAVSTTNSLVRNDPNRFPSSGQAIIQGGRGSKARVTAVDARNVRVELDADGDGTYETDSTIAWDNLG